MFDEKEVKVLVTGFGPFLDITTNPSWEIARQLPSTISTFTASQIRVILPQDPIPAAYHQIYSRIPRLLEERNPDIVLHMGLEVESPAGCFKIERKAPKEGYHQIPDIERKVFTRAENTSAFGKKGPAKLACGLDLEDVEARWRDACRSISLPADGREILKQAGKGLKKDQRGKPIDVCLTDDVGTYVCGFCYYLGLHEMQKKTGQKNVVFLHVPNLDDEEKVKAGVRVTEELIKALVAVWEENRLS